jgi:peptidyl-tRNA hydrolase, PTH2 family
MRAAKQVIVMRKDLNMRKGKMIAQGAHASMKVILDRRRDPGAGKAAGTGHHGAESAPTLSIETTEAMWVWLSGPFTKICVSVQSEAELDAVYARAQAAGVPCAMIVDAGHTEFAGVPTKTCCAIGPAWVDEVDAVTAALPLL